MSCLLILPALVWTSALGAESPSANPAQRSLVRGVVRSSSQAVISTDLTARVAEVGFREGAHFSKGDVLVAFDCRRQKAELASAEAQYREMLVAFESASFLEKRNAGSRQDIETARARADRAAAEAEVIRARLDQCTITAPFDGSVAELGIHEHETPVAGTQLLFIVAKREPRIELIVPSTWLTWLKPGAEFQFRVDETRKPYVGIVRRLGAAVDTVSQTVKVFAAFTTPTPDVLPGMSGTARF
jgi:RND family efflux transporter MFP subunit